MTDHISIHSFIENTPSAIDSTPYHNTDQPAESAQESMPRKAFVADLSHAVTGFTRFNILISELERKMACLISLTISMVVGLQKSLSWSQVILKFTFSVGNLLTLYHRPGGVSRVPYVYDLHQF